MYHWRGTHRTLLLMAAALCVAAARPSAPDAAAPSPSLIVSAGVDKTKVMVGEQLTLTITLSGDLEGVQLQEQSLPAPFVVVAQSHSQSVHRFAARTERSTSFVYLLVPREAGAFQLGPFHVSQGKQAYATEPISVEVIRSPLPPPSSRPVQRLTI